jgi:hypothetical protein
MNIIDLLKVVDNGCAVLLTCARLKDTTISKFVNWLFHTVNLQVFNKFQCIIEFLEISIHAYWTVKYMYSVVNSVHRCLRSSHTLWMHSYSSFFFLKPHCAKYLYIFQKNRRVSVYKNVAECNSYFTDLLKCSGLLHLHLMSAFCKFYGRYNNLIYNNKLSLCHMFSDIFHTNS